MTARTNTVIDSPVGPITLRAVDGILSGLFFAEHRHPPSADTLGRSDPRGFGQAREQLTAYFDGRLTEFDLPLAPAGTPFQHQVWDALRTIPYGETATYAEIADRIGRPTASRAVGAANGRNPISIVVPCHRIVGADGSLTGYGGGLDRKRALLDLEQAHGGSDGRRSARSAELG